MELLTIYPTLKERGHLLPVGIPSSDGSLHREFSFRPWRFAEERELYDLREQEQSLNAFRYANLVLTTMFDRLGPHDFKAMPSVQRSLIVSEMFLADVLYAYVALRAHAIGNVLPMTLACGLHQPPLRFEFKAGIDTTEVRAVGSLPDSTWMFDLRDPVKLRGKEVTSLKLGPPRFFHFERFDRGSGPGAFGLKVATILSSIFEVGDQGAIALLPQELEAFSKFDFEALLAGLEKRRVGLRLVVDAPCPKCGATIQAPIDWGNEGFFAPFSP